MQFRTRQWFSVGASLGFLGLAAVMGVGAQGCTITTSDGPLDGGDFDGSVSNDDGSVTSPTPDGGSPDGAAPSCAECLIGQCTPNFSVCQNDPECQAIYSCATAAGADVTACYCAHPAGQAKYISLAACDSVAECATCKTACPTLATAEACASPGVVATDICGTSTDDGGVADDAATADDGGTGETDATAVGDCSTCTSTSCAPEKTACGAGTDCEAFTVCIAACQDAACFDTCGAAHATGKTASQALETCTVTNCKAACGL